MVARGQGEERGVIPCVAFRLRFILKKVSRETRTPRTFAVDLVDLLYTYTAKLQVGETLELVMECLVRLSHLCLPPMTRASPSSF